MFIFQRIRLKHGHSADRVRGKMGLDNIFKEMQPEIAELRRVASEGLDPNEFRRNAANTIGGAMKGVTGQAQKGLGQVGDMYGSALSGGLMSKYRDAFTSKKVATFGSMLGSLLKKDDQTRTAAKQQLIDLVMKKSEMDQQLVMSDEMRRAQMG